MVAAVRLFKKPQSDHLIDAGADRHFDRGMA